MSSVIRDRAERDYRGGAAALSRTISLGSTTTRAEERAPDVISASRSVTLWRPTSPKSWRTVVSGGVKNCGLGNVVEADDAELPGNLTTHFVQRAQDAEGHLIVGREHSRDFADGHQPLPELVAGARAPVAGKRWRYVGACPSPSAGSSI